MEHETQTETQVPTEIDTAQAETSGIAEVPARTKYVLATVAVLFAFFASYSIALATSGTSESWPTAGDCGTEDACGSADACGGETVVFGDASQAGAEGSCCGGESVTVEGAATIDGDIQRVYVDVSAGYFDPNVIHVAAGVPIEITFGEGTGCMAEVMFKDFAVFESLTQGGAVVDLPALEAGEYGFSCGMEMVFGVIIAE